jgi:diguanylate cyclase (GGDEF)-like protein
MQTTPKHRAAPFGWPFRKSDPTIRHRQTGARRSWVGAALLPLWLATGALAAEPDPTALLKKADAIKLANYASFTTLMQSIEARARELNPAEQEYLHYLRGWNSAYRGQYDEAIATLSKVIDESKNPALQLRASATIINVLSISRRQEEAFTRLDRLVALLPEVTDKDAREQALLVAAYTYSEVDQYNLTLRYAQTIIDENWAGRGACKGGQVKLKALLRTGKLTTESSELRAGIDSCVKLGELGFANTIRTYAARLYIDNGRYDDAIAMLKQHYDEVVQSKYRRLISGFDALLAEAYRKKGMPGLAKQFGFDAIANAVQHEYTEPLVNAYAVLYGLAKDEGDYKAALSFYEQFAAADKGYLDDLSARHLAYQKVTHENVANRLQVEALNKQNHVLQLEQQLSAKAVETSRLYIALLALIVIFVGFWAYRTKRLQLHFMSLSQLDGLTGIANRPYFIEQADKALETGAKTGDSFCIVLCDLDHFKAINDSHGHAAGDDVLKRAVAECRAHLHPNDTFGRFGGEEFGMLFPACDPQDAWERCEKMRAAIASITLEHTGDASVVTASFGIAATRTSGYELRQLLAHADSALYEAKRTGRNRVVMHDATLTADALAEQRVIGRADNKKLASG